MKKITAYEDSNGNLHKDRAGAIKVEEKARITRQLLSLMETKDFYFNGMQGEVADFIYENEISILEILTTTTKYPE